MYQPVQTESSFQDTYGNTHTPVATLRDEYGGICHVVEDDHCYVLYLRKCTNFQPIPEGCLEVEDGMKFHKTPYIFREAHELLKMLPTLS